MSLEAKNSLLSLSPAQPSPTQPSPATLALAAPGTTAQLPWPGLGASSYARQPSWDLRDSLTDANFTVAVAGLKDPEDSTLALFFSSSLPQTTPFLVFRTPFHSL